MTTVAELEKIVDGVTKSVADVKAYAEKVDNALGDVVARMDALDKRMEEMSGGAGEDIVSLKDEAAALRRDVDKLKGNAQRGSSKGASGKRMARIEQMLGLGKEPDEEDDENTGDVAYGREGDKVMAYRPEGFKNPTESPVGYGDSEEEALADLEKAEEK